MTSDAAEELPGRETEDAPADESSAPREAPAAEQDQGDAGDEAEEARSAATVEAILFATEKPLPPAKVSEIGQVGGVRRVRRAVERLNRRYEQTGSSFRIVQIAGGYQMQTLPEYGDVLARISKSREESRLSQPALETLAVIAYRQPSLRADLEAIRGVASGEVIRGLLEKNLVRITGRAEEIGRPLLYGTTKHFLEVFGLADLGDLPNAQQLRLPAKTEEPAATQQPPADGQAQPPASEAPQGPKDGTEQRD